MCVPCAALELAEASCCCALQGLAVARGESAEQLLDPTGPAQPSAAPAVAAPSTTPAAPVISAPILPAKNSPRDKWQALPMEEQRKQTQAQIEENMKNDER